ncbi:MAG: hypothetical protein ACJ76Y_10855 [Thermoanaerobaculia bacterium]
MVRLRASLAALLLLACATAVAQERASPPQPKCREYGPAPVLRICTELDANKLKGTGHSTAWTIRVEGGSRGTKVRLHNHSPAVVVLEGGDDQIVSLKRGGEIRRKVTQVSREDASASLVATPYDPSPARESAILAAFLSPRLERVEAWFAGERGRLAESGYSAEAAGRLLDKTEADLLELLSYPELSALRGYVQVKLREARIELSKAPLAAGMGVGRPLPRAIPALWTPAAPSAAVRVANPPPASGRRLHKKEADSVLDRVLRMIQRLRELARTGDLYTRLCIVSAPGDGARFMMRPQLSDASERVEINTNGEIQAYRGLYVFSIRKSFRQRIDCEKLDHEDCILIDLVDDPKPVFYCDFNKKNCERRPGPVLVGVCHDDGR